MQENIFSSHDLDFLNRLPEVAEAKDRLEFNNTASFRIVCPEISNRLKALNLPAPTEIPMRWIKGDTLEHVDSGSREFERTSLVYLSGSGDFIIGADTFSIHENRAFTFDEGVKHRTENASTRLILGPMNEHGQEVGGFNDPSTLTQIGVMGPFQSWFSATSPVEALSYSNYLRSYSDNGAFAQNFHTVQFRQFDSALDNFRNNIGNTVPFSQTSDWIGFLRNTTFMLQNVNERINLINEGLQAIFGNADVFSNTTFTQDYLSATDWPKGDDWTYLPASLTDNIADFADATYAGDSNVVNPP